jgi:hypothetical protein
MGAIVGHGYGSGTGMDTFTLIDKVESASHPVTNPNCKDFNSVLITRWPAFLGKNILEPVLGPPSRKESKITMIPKIW